MDHRNRDQFRTSHQILAFLEGNDPAEIHLAYRDAADTFINRTRVRFGYHDLGRAVPFDTGVSAPEWCKPQT